VTSDCGRCGLAIKDNGRAFVLYVNPDPHDTARVSVHDVCIADEVAEGRLVRTSPFAFRTAPVSEVSE
jgi:hypothetical protein